MTTIFDYINSFWAHNAQKPCSTTEVALYFYLLNEVNHNHWNMPVKCCTELIRIRLKTTKQNIIKARNGLKEHGLIKFTKGRGKDDFASYILVYKLQNSSNSSKNLKQMDTSELTNQLSEALSDKLSEYNNIKKKDKDNFIRINKKSQEKILTPNDLEKHLLNDYTWRQNLLKLLAAEGIVLSDVEIKEKLDTFFLMLKTTYPKGKSEPDCRQYAYNWIKNYYKKNQHVKDNEPYRRRAVEVPLAKPEEYTQPFYSPNGRE